MTDEEFLEGAVGLLAPETIKAALATRGLRPGGRLFERACRRHGADEQIVAMLWGWVDDCDRWVPSETREDVSLDGFPVGDEYVLARAIRRTLNAVSRRELFRG